MGSTENDRVGLIEHQGRDFAQDPAALLGSGPFIAETVRLLLHQRVCDMTVTAFTRQRSYRSLPCHR